MSANVDSQTGGLRELRRAAGLSQELVARRAKCSTGYVRLLEQGFAPATSDVVPRIERVLLAALNDCGTPGKVSRSHDLEANHNGHTVR